MANTYSTRLRLILQETGQNSGTWGTNLNASMIQLADDAIAGYTTVGMAAGTTTLSPVDGNTDQARMAFIETNGTNTSVNHIVIPGVSKGYWIRQNSTSAIIVRTAGGSGFTVSAGTTQFLICDSASVWCATSAQVPSGYQQGTFTPAFNDNVGFITYNFQTGRYIRVGNMCTFWAAVRVSTWSSADMAGSNMYLSNLPFAWASVANSPMIMNVMRHTGLSVCPSVITITGLGQDSAVSTGYPIFVLQGQEYNGGAANNFKWSQTTSIGGHPNAQAINFVMQGSYIVSV